MSTNCSNCYNGCAQIVSDKCVKYTGDPSEALGIETGDTLLSVEETLINNVVSFLDGTGIDITINPTAYCTLVTSYLPSCKPICSPPTAVELFEALVKAACDLQEQVDAVVADVAELNSDYDVDCLDGVTDSSDTHDVVQAIITKLCELGVDLAALALDVDTNYVKKADINTYIAAYLSSLSTGTQQYLKMVPYTVVEYYGALTNYPTVSDGFGPTGIGFGAWEKVYLCNGLNGTPDKRGRVPVGVTSGMGGGAFDPAVDPAIAGNPAYTISGATSKAGANTVTLTSAQLPAHTHTATASITDPGHRHDIWGITGGDNDDMSNTVRFAGGDKIQSETSFYFTNTQACQTSTTGLNSSNVSITVSANTGGGGAHANNQPALACYYIMYIP
jgi:microcystin-dependent protein